jgi:hypothetical protein
MKKQLYNLILIAGLAILSTSCGKKGDIGPQGAQGKQGDKGEAGATGAAGTNGTNGSKGDKGDKGDTGNANVQTDLFTIQSADWATNSTYWFGTGNLSATGYTTKTYERANALITADLLNTGMVMVYMQSSPTTNAAQWQPIPLSFLYSAGSGSYTYNYAFETLAGKVRLHFYFVKISADPPPLNTYAIPPHQFKIIAVTGIQLTAMKAKNVDIKNFAQVSNYLNSIN